MKNGLINFGGMEQRSARKVHDLEVGVFESTSRYLKTDA